MGRSRAARIPQDPLTVHIESMSQDGMGVARVDGRSVYIHGALSGETVLFRYTRIKGQQAEGAVDKVLIPSPDRVPAECHQYGVCGGCSLQHQRPSAQIRDKQQILLQAFSSIGNVAPETILPPLASDRVWGYRKKARLGVKYVAKKERVLVGFRERRSGFICDTERCLVLDPKIGELLIPLAQMIGELSIKDRIPQIEVAIDDSDCILIFRLLSPASAADLQRLSGFCDAHGILPYLQEGGAESLRPLSGKAKELCYRLPAHELEFRFLPTDFTQVNSGLNSLMVDHALQLLDPKPGERVLDLFCGLGNFTLPLARSTGNVTGVEGDVGLVARARQNALMNNIHNARFFAADLYQPLENEPWLHESFEKVLLDPPRSGAQQVLRYLPETGAHRIVYVSCYPDTLARDAGELVNLHGYRLVAAGVMDMFPHTAHVESIALFEAY
ncbi:MAG: 23S rRNA (uracil(1939)-C(5))-methyltransferase RlmD [Chromatiaceae bacterium]|nr:23S rRNA (uracil(1939)-C(5))-methyltransferase RlmD [Chromatiaceae bacterium]MCP5445106.1 23S rRNA (uracil(1939)-C(5))-methyltransferase RlmD [Chromatiaceae bacterium]